MKSLIFCLILVILPSSQATCELKVNARDLVTVDYATTDEKPVAESDTVYVDEIVVKMKDEQRYQELLQDGCNSRRHRVTVYYKKETEEAWTKHGNKKMTSRGDFEIQNLDPCEIYEVRVTALSSETLVGTYKVGPYYSRTFKKDYLIDRDNEHYLSYVDFSSKHINVTGYETTAYVELADLCAKSVAVHVYTNDDISQGIEKIISIDPADKSIQKSFMDSLDACTKYNVALDLFLMTLDASHPGHEDVFLSGITSFYTMPNSEDLKGDTYINYNEADKVLSWNFKPFFEQDCANEDNVEMDFTLEIEGNISLVSEEGSHDVGKDRECDFYVELKVDYRKGNWNRTVLAFNRTIPGFNEIEDKLILVEGKIVKTVNPCDVSDQEVEVIALTPTARFGSNDTEDMRVTFPGDLSSPQVISEVKWQGCADHSVRLSRDGRIVADLEIEHPGWAGVLPLLEIDGKSDRNITFKKPEDKCDSNKFAIEILCMTTDTKDEGSGLSETEEVSNATEVVNIEKEEVLIALPTIANIFEIASDPEPENETETEEETLKEFSHTFDFEDDLQITGLNPGTEYQCQGRIINIGEDSQSEWTPSVLVSTDKEEVVTTPLLTSTTANLFEIASDPEPKNETETEVVTETDIEPETETELKLIVEAEREKPDVEPKSEDAISDANAQPVASPKGDAGRVGPIINLVACCILLAFKGGPLIA